MEYERRKILENFEKQKNLIGSRLGATIEANRKGFCAIRIVDAEKNPITDATVKVVQKNHAFRYGANIFMLDEVESEVTALPLERDPQGQFLLGF